MGPGEKQLQIKNNHGLLPINYRNAQSQITIYRPVNSIRACGTVVSSASCSSIDIGHVTVQSTDIR